MLRKIFFALFVLVLLEGCAYSFSKSTLPGHLKSIVIQPIDNKTYYSLLADDLYQAMEQTFRREAPKLKQVDQAAHCELYITLSKYSNQPLNYSASGQVSQYQTTMDVSVRFFDVVKETVLYENKSLKATGEYNVDEGETETAHGQARAIQNLQQLLTSNLLSKW